MTIIYLFVSVNSRKKWSLSEKKSVKIESMADVCQTISEGTGKREWIILNGGKYENQNTTDYRYCITVDSFGIWY